MKLCIVILVSQLVYTSSMVDEFMSCDRLFDNSGEGAKARSARHLLEGIPCDMKKQSFCSHKGSVYPEAAIWRFKEENRALMRRLYGDMESTTLYREMRSTAEKSSTNPHTSRSRKANTKSKQSRSGPILLPHIARSPAGVTSLFSTLDYNIRIGSGLATVQSAKDPIMQSRLATRLGGGRLKIKKKIVKKQKTTTAAKLSANSSMAENNPQHHVIFNSKMSSEKLDTLGSLPNALELKEERPMEQNASSAGKESTTTVRVSTTSTVSSVSVKASTSEDPTVQPTTLSPSTVRGDMTDSTMLYPTTTMDNENIFTTDTVPMLGDFTTLDSSETSQGSTTMSDDFDDVTTQQNQEQTIGVIDEDPELAASIETICKLLEKAGMKSCDDILKEMAQTDSLEPTESDEAKGPETATDESTNEGIDYVDDSIYYGASTSACPVRREVVSPYWANNTRQQTLALLNIYPFEQYVHMEMCKLEHHEMLCRPGCKCEQQYRMHRLLAFDPSNECRGIFSDWFELPSFCVCKCYESATENFVPRPRKPRIDTDPENEDRKGDGVVENARAYKKLQNDSNVNKSNPNYGKHNKLRTNNEKSNIQNIPAIFPYEAKLALLKEIRHRENRNLLKSLEVPNSAIIDSIPTEISKEDELKNNEKDTTDLSKKSVGRTETVSDSKQIINSQHTNKISLSTMKSSTDERDDKHKTNEEHFLYNVRYGNLPVMEFKLPDGSSGSVEKVPRRR